MLEGGGGRRHFYLGIDFVKRDTGLAALDSWQQEVVEQYPDVAGLNLTPPELPSLIPEGSVSLRIHSIGGWGAITMGKNLALTTFELLGLHVKANPKYGSEKKGQPTTFFGTISPEPVLTNAELKQVDVVLSPDPNVFGHSDPLGGLSEGGAFVIQSDQEPAELLKSLPPAARSAIRERKLRVYALDGFQIASEEASDAELRYRMQGAAFMGAFFAVSPLTEREGLDRERLFEGIHAQLAKKFGHLGEQVVDDNLRVIQRGFDELREITTADGLAEAAEIVELVAVGAGGEMPPILNVPSAQPGIAHPGRFWDQVCTMCNIGEDPIADPFAAISAMPAGSSAIRDMTNVRFEVPEFIPDLCTGCAQCWVQCPDVAIPGLVNTTGQILDTAIATVAEERPLELIREISAELAGEAHRLLGAEEFTTFDNTLATAYATVAGALPWDSERKTALDDEFAVVAAFLADFPLAKTVPFFEVLERKQEGSGGLVSITINPDACKGCNLCVDVCPEDALITVRQDERMNERLRRNWKLWERLPDTDDRFLNISNIEEGIGVLPTLLLKKDVNGSMVSGDGACMGCGEKTSIHLVLSTIEALMQPRVRAYVERLDGLVSGLESKSRELLATGADLDAAAEVAEGETVGLVVDAARRDELQELNDVRKALEDLRWRYLEGPSGRGRSTLGITNSTGCSSVWGSTFPYNPYPYPWVNHLFQDAPSIAIGVFEGHMRKMADAFTAVRRAELYLDDAYDAAKHEPFFEAFDWREFDDDEFALCPPILSIGGDGAMFDIGFQNLSRLLASGKPIRVIILDTQVYSNTGGQACTSGFIGQVSDMAAWGGAQHGKEETRKEIAMIAMAHRGAFVMQTSQALPSHLMGGMLQALQTRRPAVVNIYTPCPVEHGLTDDWAAQASRLALESRAFPHLVYDPDAGSSFSECLDLAGNPSANQVWPTYQLEGVDEDGEECELDLPLTVADWAATEGRFRRHFRELPAAVADESLMAFADYVAATAEEREGRTPFIYTIDDDRLLKRLQVSDEIVDLGIDRVLLWSQLRQMAGTEVSDAARRLITRELEAQFQQQAEALKAEYEQRLAHLKATYPQVIARRLAEGLLSGDGGSALSVVLGGSIGSEGGALTSIPPTIGNGAQAAIVAPVNVPAGSNGASAIATAPPEETAATEEDEADAASTGGPTIDTELCTTCDECTNINNDMFSYDENKQAYVKDVSAGTFKELVMSAERCTALIIHPGAPHDPTEPDLEKWIERAAPFN
jgi:pyruvate-ferredoxin/flavodoxin oxidoreductase